MTYMVIFFLAALAMGGAEECAEKRAEACVANFLTAISDDTTQEEACNELSTALECMKKTVDDCLGGQVDDDVEKSLQVMEQMVSSTCEADDSDDDEAGTEIEKCVENNEEAIYECIFHTTMEALEAIAEDGDDMDEAEESAMQCAMFVLMANCISERIREQCGVEAKEKIEAEIEADIPEDVAEACKKAGGLNKIEEEIPNLKKKK